MFDNRMDAAQQLLAHLQEYQQKDSVILCIPRGGVPLGNYIAESLGQPLDVVLTKKIGHPRQKELAIGAVSMNSRIIDMQYDVPQDYIEEETSVIRKQLQHRYELYKGKEEGIELEGKHIILIDDGIATGNTMLATVELIKKNQPASVTIAVPVSSVNAQNLLQPQVDRYISLHTPADFGSVSRYYEEFNQVSNEEVIALLH